MTSEDPYYVSDNLLAFTTSNNDRGTEELLVEEMDNCRQLLELEPDSKWTLLTLALIAQSVDPVKHYQEIVTIYDRLTKVDPKRRNYYLDQRSKFVTRHEITEFYRAYPGSSEIDLSNKGLTKVYFRPLLALATSVNLSSNRLKSVQGLVPYLVQCRKLHLDGNDSCCAVPEKFQ